MLQFAIIVLTVVAVLCLFGFGDWEERTIGAAVAVLMVVAPLVASLQFGTTRPGVALIEGMFLLGILYLAMTRDRWWLLALAGFQTISVATHLIALINPNHFLWTAVTVRLEVWVLICATLFIGAWEAWAARRFAREGADHEHKDVGRRVP